MPLATTDFRSSIGQHHSGCYSDSRKKKELDALVSAGEQQEITLGSLENATLWRNRRCHNIRNVSHHTYSDSKKKKKTSVKLLTGLLLITAVGIFCGGAAVGRYYPRSSARKNTTSSGNHALETSTVLSAAESIWSHPSGAKHNSSTYASGSSFNSSANNHSPDKPTASDTPNFSAQNKKDSRSSEPTSETKYLKKPGILNNRKRRVTTGNNKSVQDSRQQKPLSASNISHDNANHKRNWLRQRYECAKNLQTESITDFLIKKSFLTSSSAGKMNKIVLLIAMMRYFQSNRETGYAEIADILHTDSASCNYIPEQTHFGLNNKRLVNEWQYEKLLNISPIDFIGKKIAHQNDPQNLGLFGISEFLTLKSLESAGVVDLTGLSEEDKDFFRQCYTKMLQQFLPLTVFDSFTDSSAWDAKLNTHYFVYLTTGSLYLSAQQSIEDFELQEVIACGKNLWDLRDAGEITASTQDFFLHPAKLYLARQIPDKYLNASDNGNLNKISLGEYIKVRFDYTMNENLNNFKTSLSKWQTRRALSRVIVNNCTDSELFALSDREGILPRSFRNMNRDRERHIERYLNGVGRPCVSAPDSLTDEYKIRTRKVATVFSELNNIYIYQVINSLPLQELMFIFSPESIINSVSVNLMADKSEFFCYANLLSLYCYPTKIKIRTRNCVFFKVTKNHEERIYAIKLQFIEKTPSYKIFRPDFSPSNYINEDIFDSNRTDIIVNGHRIIIGTSVYNLEITTASKQIKKTNESHTKITEYINQYFVENFYNRLYQDGLDETTTQKIFRSLSHLLPFYDCIRDIVNQNYLPAAVACSFDVVNLALPFSGLPHIAELGVDIYLHANKEILHHIISEKDEEILDYPASFLKNISPSSLAELNYLDRFFTKNKDKDDINAASGNDNYYKKLVRQLNRSLSAQNQNLIHKLKEPPVTSFETFPLVNSDIVIPVSRVAEVVNISIYAAVYAETGEIENGPLMIKQFGSLIPVDLLSSSLHVSYKLNEIILPGMFDASVEAENLSSSDATGLRWSPSGNAYLKYDNKYLSISFIDDKPYLKDTAKGNLHPLIFINNQFCPDPGHVVRKISDLQSLPEPQQT